MFYLLGLVWYGIGIPVKKIGKIGSKITRKLEGTKQYSLAEWEKPSLKEENACIAIIFNNNDTYKDKNGTNNNNNKNSDNNDKKTELCSSKACNITLCGALSLSPCECECVSKNNNNDTNKDKNGNNNNNNKNSDNNDMKTKLCSFMLWGSLYIIFYIIVFVGNLGFGMIFETFINLVRNL